MSSYRKQGSHRSAGKHSRRRYQDEWDDRPATGRSSRRGYLDEEEEIGGEARDAKGRYSLSDFSRSPLLPGIMSIIIVLFVFGTYMLASQVRGKALELVRVKDVNTALEFEVKQSLVGSQALTEQLKALETDLIKAQEQCTHDVSNMDTILREISQNITDTKSKLERERDLTAALIKENSALEKKLLALKET